MIHSSILIILPVSNFIFLYVIKIIHYLLITNNEEEKIIEDIKNKFQNSTTDDSFEITKISPKLIKSENEKSSRSSLVHLSNKILNYHYHTYLIFLKKKKKN